MSEIHPTTALRDGKDGRLERVRHVKRGTEYEVLGEAEVQVATGHAFLGETGPVSFYQEVSDGSRLTVYRDPNSGKLWARFTDEFRDGRFETVAAAPSPDTAGYGGDLEELRKLKQASEEADADYYERDRGSYVMMDAAKYAFEQAAITYVRKLLPSIQGQGDGGTGATPLGSGHSRAEPFGLGPEAECPSRGEISDAAIQAALKVYHETHDTANVDDEPEDLDHAAMEAALYEAAKFSSTRKEVMPDVTEPGREGRASGSHVTRPREEVRASGGDAPHEPSSQATAIPSRGHVLLPRDDDSRPLNDSVLPSVMIWDGGDAYDELRRRSALPAGDPEALDLDSCAMAVGIYRAMVKAAGTALRSPGFAAAIPSGGWRPIETAPRNGTKVLLRFAPPFNDIFETGIVTGLNTGQGWWLSAIWDGSQPHKPPTHWMPLPAPPSALAGETAKAAETGTGSVEDEHAACKATPKHSPEPNPPMSVEEARAFLDGCDPELGELPVYAQFCYQQWADPKLPSQYRMDCFSRASRIEAALRALSEHGEVKS